MPKKWVEAALDDGLQHDIRVDAVVWGEESGRGSVSGLEGGVGDVDHRPASRDVEDRDGGGTRSLTGRSCCIMIIEM